jgi:hypothetical protein
MGNFQNLYRFDKLSQHHGRRLSSAVGPHQNCYHCYWLDSLKVLMDMLRKVYLELP